MNNESLFGEISFSPLSCCRKTLQSRGVLISSSSSAQFSLPSVCRTSAVFSANSRTQVTVQTSLSRGTWSSVSQPPDTGVKQEQKHHHPWRSGEVSLCWAETQQNFETFKNILGVEGKAEYKIILMLWLQIHTTQHLPGCKPMLMP